jgi:hypothetical protein
VRGQQRPHPQLGLILRSAAKWRVSKDLAGSAGTAWFKTPGFTGLLTTRVWDQFRSATQLPEQMPPPPLQVPEPLVAESLPEPLALRTPSPTTTRSPPD